MAGVLLCQAHPFACSVCDTGSGCSTCDDPGYPCLTPALVTCTESGVIKLHMDPELLIGVGSTRGMSLGFLMLVGHVSIPLSFLRALHVRSCGPWGQP
jgi:hypothetical protein